MRVAFTATAATGLLLDVDQLFDPLQVRGQRAAVALGGAGLVRLGRDRIQPGLHAGDRGVDLLERQLELGTPSLRAALAA